MRPIPGLTTFMKIIEHSHSCDAFPCGNLMWAKDEISLRIKFTEISLRNYWEHNIPQVRKPWEPQENII